MPRLFLRQTEPIRPDADVDSSNWIKQTWDLPEIDSVAKLKAFLKRNGKTVAQFKRSTLYRMNKDKLPWLKRL